MSKFSHPVRSVRDIKTLAGKSDDHQTPHKLYMRLFALETERHRRMQERASAMGRVAIIDARCVDIDREKAELLALLGMETLPEQLAAEGADDLGGPAPAVRAWSAVRRRPAGPSLTPATGDYAPPPFYESVKIRY